jgi:hypothetical protein
MGIEGLNCSALESGEIILHFRTWLLLAGISRFGMHDGWAWNEATGVFL